MPNNDGLEEVYCITTSKIVYSIYIYTYVLNNYYFGASMLHFFGFHDFHLNKLLDLETNLHLQWSGDLGAVFIASPAQH